MKKRDYDFSSKEPDMKLIYRDEGNKNSAFKYGNRFCCYLTPHYFDYLSICRFQKQPRGNVDFDGTINNDMHNSIIHNEYIQTVTILTFY